MLVDLRSLQPNPMRDFTVDPMDDEVVAKLRQSIEEDGFWGGVVCRRTTDGIIQIAAGHHRITAAIAAGIEAADLFVGNGTMDDAAMIRVYARENATQRGNSGTAQAGSVASAVRFLAKSVLTGGAGEFASSINLRKIQGNLASEQGIGRDIIVSFLANIPGIIRPGNDRLRPPTPSGACFRGPLLPSPAVRGARRFRFPSPSPGRR